MPFKVSAPIIVIIMGVAGSGKTTIASLLAERLNWEFKDADQFHPQVNIDKLQGGNPLTDEDRWPWLNSIAAWIDEMQRTGKCATIACSALKQSYRKILIGQRRNVRIVYLKGEHDLIAHRLAVRRSHFMPRALLDSQFDTLQEPGADECPVTVSIHESPHKIVERILAKLAVT